MGEGLYSISDARPALEPGIYRLTGPHEEPRDARVVILANGMTRFSDGDADDVYGFVPLDPGQGTFVGWFTSKDQDQGHKPIQIYFVAGKRTDGSFVIYLPRCSGPEAELARTFGAQVEAGPGPACRFPNRARLESALRQLRPADTEAIRLVRQSDR